MKKELISVIVPIYRVERYIHKCIDSILRQTYSNLEIILVDDGSPDSCPEICDKYLKIDTRIKVIHKSNGGLSSARNAGLNIALGKYIAFVDGDDYIHPDMMKDLYITLDKNKADVAVCNLQYVDEKGNPLLQFSNNIIKREVLSADEVFFKSFGNDGQFYTVVCNKLYKRELWAVYRFEEGKIHEDEFIFHHIIGQCKRISCIPNRDYYYVQREKSIMAEQTLNQRMDYIEALLERMSFFKKENKRDLLPVVDEYCCFGLSDMKKLLKTEYERERFSQLEKRYDLMHKWNLKNTDYSIMIRVKLIVYKYMPFLTKLFIKLKAQAKKTIRIIKG